MQQRLRSAAREGAPLWRADPRTGFTSACWELFSDVMVAGGRAGGEEVVAGWLSSPQPSQLPPLARAEPTTFQRARALNAHLSTCEV